MGEASECFIQSIISRFTARGIDVAISGERARDLLRSGFEFHDLSADASLDWHWCVLKGV